MSRDLAKILEDAAHSARALGAPNALLSPDVADEAAQAIVDLTAAVKQWASECGECGGTGMVPDGEAVTGRGPDDVLPNILPCGECEDIRAVLAKVGAP